MIAHLNGTLAYRKDPYLIIDVNGVGYKVLASHDILSKNYKTGEPLKLFTYTHVREDAFELYGFSNQYDLDLFEQLISISGIGPKTAIGIFSVGGSSQIIQAIFSADVNFFSAVPRLGKKNAQKIIIELKNKVGSKQDLDLSDDLENNNSDLVSALKVFGFSRNEIEKAIKQLDGNGETLEEKVKMALKYLGK